MAGNRERFNQLPQRAYLLYSKTPHFALLSPARALEYDEPGSNYGSGLLSCVMLGKYFTSLSLSFLTINQVWAFPPHLVCRRSQCANVQQEAHTRVSAAKMSCKPSYSLTSHTSSPGPMIQIRGKERARLTFPLRFPSLVFLALSPRHLPHRPEPRKRALPETLPPPAAR